jgi:hypothetical protein
MGCSLLGRNLCRDGCYACGTLVSPIAPHTSGGNEVGIVIIILTAFLGRDGYVVTNANALRSQRFEDASNQVLNGNLYYFPVGLRHTAIILT